MKKSIFILAPVFLTAAIICIGRPIKTQTKDNLRFAKNSDTGRTSFRVHFNQVFKDNGNGTVSPLVPVNINGVLMTPGVSTGSGVPKKGLNLYKIKGKDLLIDTLNGVVYLKGYFDK